MKRLAILGLLMFGAFIHGCRGQEKDEGVEPQSVTIADSNHLSSPFAVHKSVLGRYQTNCYILKPIENQGECVIVDTSLDEMGPLMNYLESEGLKPAAVICTHGHQDHTNGVAYLREKYPDMHIYIHKDDAGVFKGRMPHGALTIIEEEGLINPIGISLRVIHLPGHSPGSICLYSESEKIALVGDVLFKGSIGKCSDEDMQILISGIKKKLLVLHAESIVYPGHGSATTIGQELRFNPYLR